MELFDYNRPAHGYLSELKKLKEQLAAASQFTAQYTNMKAGETLLPTGLAISPDQAAICADEVSRSVTFIRGLRRALEELVPKGRNRVRVLYAGCGPWALLAIPQMMVFSPDQLDFIFLDIHPESLEAARTLVESLGLSSYVSDYVLADAAVWEIPAGIQVDVILSETMNVTLKDEPQVSIFRNLLRQAPEALLIPSNVEVSLSLVNLVREYSWNYYKEHPVEELEKDRVALGTVFELNRETIVRWSEETASTLPAAMIKIPDSFHKYYEPILLTRITVFGDQMLLDNEASLTIPQHLPGDPVIRGGEELHFCYRLGDNPGLEFEIAPPERDLGFTDTSTTRIVEFLMNIGLFVEKRSLGTDTTDPGVDVEFGTLLVDESKLENPGDLLFKAGHLALTKTPKRNASGTPFEDREMDMAVMAWAYAAALHLGLEPEMVFHERAFNGWSQSLLDNFSKGHYIGVPMLSYMGLTREGAQQGNASIYPHMEKWVVE